MRPHFKVPVDLPKSRRRGSLMTSDVPSCHMGVPLVLQRDTTARVESYTGLCGICNAFVMFSRFYDVAKSSPFGSPFSVASCSTGKESALMAAPAEGRTLCDRLEIDVTGFRHVHSLQQVIWCQISVSQLTDFWSVIAWACSARNGCSLANSYPTNLLNPLSGHAGPLVSLTFLSGLPYGGIVLRDGSFSSAQMTQYSSLGKLFLRRAFSQEVRHSPHDDDWCYIIFVSRFLE